MAMIPCSASQEQQSDVKDLKTIQVKFEIKPAKSRIIKEGDTEYLESQYDPSEDIILGLRNVGFIVQMDNNSNADMILTVTHVENAYATMARGVPISQEVGIKVLEFNLKDAKSTILIKTVSIDKFSYGRVYSPRYVDMKMVKNSFVKKLVELVTIRSEKLIEILELNKNNTVDEDFLMKRGIKNKNYFSDIIDILGSIADARAVKILNLYVNHTELGDDAKESIANSKSRSN